MTVKRINSTGRQKILREDAKVYISEQPEGSLKFSAQLNLSGYDLPPSALVFIEAYRKSTLMRFPFGTVTDPRPSGDNILSEFIHPDGLLFRIKVLGASERQGMLLADGEIPVSDDKERPENRVALLPPRPEDLGAEVWRIDFSSGSPELLVNEKLRDWKGAVQTAEFRSLVFPAAVRQVLERILWATDAQDIEDESSWAHPWVKFAESLPGVDKSPPPIESNELEWIEWVDRVCERFAAKYDLLNTISIKLDGEG